MIQRPEFPLFSNFLKPLVQNIDENEFLLEKYQKRNEAVGYRIFDKEK